MNFLLKLILLVAIFQHEAKAQPYSAVIAPLHKHTDTGNPLYSIEVMTKQEQTFSSSNYLIDIDAPLIWRNCNVLVYMRHATSCTGTILCPHPVSCDEYLCTEVRTTYSYDHPSCPPISNTSSVWGYCTCSVNFANPLTGVCGQAQLNYDDFVVRTSDGKNAFTETYDAYPNAACAPPSALEKFPTNVLGVMALSSSPYALPANLLYQLNQVVAICLPSTVSAPGVMLYGYSAYYLNPQSMVDVRSYLSYTPLIKVQDSFGYFISVNSIVIKKRSIDLGGNTTTKLSTLDPYTILRTDVYNQVVHRFSRVTKRIPPAKAVAPFGVCFAINNGTRSSLKVPDIDFILPEGKKWSISTGNSIKQVTEDVACLGFVDGSATSEHRIVIGTFQLEDNFVVFDLEQSSFGFSSSLLRKQTSCTNFNFTLSN